MQILSDARTERVRGILERLCQGIDGIVTGPGDWNIRVLGTSPATENAFVVGGNYIYVYSGLIDNATNDSELAFVLGHEIAHSLLKRQVRHDDDVAWLVGTLIKAGAALSKAGDDNLMEKRSGPVVAAIISQTVKGQDSEWRC